jgi:hypothetical protein
MLNKPIASEPVLFAELWAKLNAWSKTEAGSTVLAIIATSIALAVAVWASEHF